MLQNDMGMLFKDYVKTQMSYVSFEPQHDQMNGI